jgi:MFS family permease
LVTISAATSLVANIPAGYFADRTTRRGSMTIATILLAASTLMYVLMPSFPGAILATMLEALGYAFLIGSGEALMHDTLVATGRTDQYVKIMGRAQSFGLIGNVILISLATLTYAVDKRLPFICGTLVVLCFLIVVRTLVEPPVTRSATRTVNAIHGLSKALRTFVHRRTVAFFMILGLMSGIYTAYTPISLLVYKDLGIDPSLFGFLYAGGNLVAAAGGLFVHHLRRLSLLQYSILDAAIGGSAMLLVGLTQSIWVAVGMFLLNMGFWRLRPIIYQDHLLRRFEGHGLKATLISTMGFFHDLNLLWLPIVFMGVTGALGYYDAFIVLGLSTMAGVSVLFMIAVAILPRLSATGTH